MGYVRDENGKLCCDVCGESGGVRRVKCPYNWCKPVALCPTCRKTHKTEKADHHNCRLAHSKFVEERQQGDALLAKGKLVRCSALAIGPDKVHVLFRNKNGEHTGFYMSHSTYDSIDIMRPATPEDFRNFGQLDPAPADFCYTPAN